MIYAMKKNKKQRHLINSTENKISEIDKWWVEEKDFSKKHLGMGA